MSRRTFTLALVAILVIALAIRVVAALSHDSIVPQADARDYDRHAVSIASGEGYPEALRVTGGPGPTAFRPPAYPYVLGVVYEISGTADRYRRWQYGRLAQALIGTVIVALIALVALQLWGRREALIAAAIGAIYPPLILAGASLLTEPLFAALLLGGIAALLHYRLRDARMRWLVLAGACAGLAGLTRGNGLVVVAVFALGAWTLKPRLSWRSLRAPATVAAAAALVIVPWTIRNAVELDAFIPVTTQTGLALGGQYNETAIEDEALWILPFFLPEYDSLFPREGLGEVELGERLTDRGIDYAVEHPSSIAKAAFWNTLRFFSLRDPVDFERAGAANAGQPPGLAELSVYAYWGLALVALAGAFTTAARRVPPFVWAMAALLIASVVLVGGSARYRAPLEPIVVLLAAVAVSRAWQRLAPSREVPGATGA